MCGGTERKRYLPDGLSDVLTISHNLPGVSGPCRVGMGLVGSPPTAFNLARQLAALPICPGCGDTKHVRDKVDGKMTPGYSCGKCQIAWTGVWTGL